MNLPGQSDLLKHIRTRWVPGVHMFTLTNAINIQYMVIGEQNLLKAEFCGCFLSLFISININFTSSGFQTLSSLYCIVCAVFGNDNKCDEDMGLDDYDDIDDHNDYDDVKDNNNDEVETICTENGQTWKEGIHTMLKHVQCV